MWQTWQTSDSSAPSGLCSQVLNVRAMTVQRQQRRLHVANQVADLIGNMQSALLPLYSHCSNVVVIGRGGKTWLAAAACRDVAGASAAPKM